MQQGKTKGLRRLLCKLFGHKRPAGYYSGPGYGRIHKWATDGIGRTHWCVIERCDRCGTDFKVALFHGLPEWSAQTTASENPHHD